MSDIVSTIFFHSKYSPSSINLLRIMEQSGLVFGDIKFLDVGKKIVRDRLNELDTGIKSVPCMVILYKNGSVDKYEGAELYKWVDHFIMINKPPTRIDPPSELWKQEEEEIEEEEKPIKRKSKPKPKKSKVKFEEEEEEEEEESILLEPDEGNFTPITPLRHTQKIRKDEGNYEEIMMDMSESVHSAPIIEKPRQSDIKAKADALAKERDIISQIKPTGEPPVNRF
jgi:hypothetical protein